MVDIQTIVRYNMDMLNNLACVFYKLFNRQQRKATYVAR